MALYYVELKCWDYGVAVGAAAAGVRVTVGSGVVGVLPVLVACCVSAGLIAAVPMDTRGVRVARGVGGVVGKIVPMRVK